MNNDNFFTAIDENGKETTYKMLYCKNVDDKPIIWYTDGSTDDSGKYNIYISSYEEKNKMYLLDSIDDEVELQKYVDIFKQDNTSN